MGWWWNDEVRGEPRRPKAQRVLHQFRVGISPAVVAGGPAPMGLARFRRVNRRTQWTGPASGGEHARERCEPGISWTLRARDLPVIRHLRRCAIPGLLRRGPHVPA